MLIKIDGYELFFRKVEYECSASDNSVVLLLNQQKIERTKESCKVFHAQAFPLIPRLLFMRKVGTDELPIVYSRTDMIETIARLFAEHPCLRQATTASYTTP